MAICTSGSSSKGWLYCGEGEPVRSQGAGFPPARRPHPPRLGHPAHLRYQPLHVHLETSMSFLEKPHQPPRRRNVRIHGAGRSLPGLSTAEGCERFKSTSLALIGSFKSFYANEPPEFRPSLPELPAETEGGTNGGWDGGSAAGAEEHAHCFPMMHSRAL